MSRGGRRLCSSESDVEDKRRAASGTWDDVDDGGDLEGKDESGGSSSCVFQASEGARDDEAATPDERRQLLFERNRLRHQKRHLEELLDHSEEANLELSGRVKSLEAETAGLRRSEQQLRRRLADETGRADAEEARAALAETSAAALRLQVERIAKAGRAAENRALERELEPELAELRSSSGRSIREEILMAQAGQMVDSVPNPFCEKPPAEEANPQADATIQTDSWQESTEAALLAVTEDRDRCRQQLLEASARIRSSAGILQGGLMHKFAELERQIRLERRENLRLSERLRLLQLGRQRSGEDRFEARFPRSLFHRLPPGQPLSPHHRRQSTGLICETFRRQQLECRQSLGSSVDALDLAVKSATAAAVVRNNGIGAAGFAGARQPERRPPTAAAATATEPDMASPDVRDARPHGNQVTRRKRRVSFGSPLSQASQEHEKYLMDLVHRPVQDDEILTEEDKRLSSRLLREAAEASSSRRRDDSASSQDGSPRQPKRPSRTSSSFMSSLKESDYNPWSLSEPTGASLSVSVSVDEFPAHHSQADTAARGSAAACGASAAASFGDPPYEDEAAAAPFPSLPDGRLRDLALLPDSLAQLEARNGSVSLIDQSRRYRIEDVPDAELEDRVRALAISFSSDATTLVGRVKRLSLARANLERNVASQLAGLEVEGRPSALLRDSIDGLNRTAETLGAVKQESRLNYAFHLMMKYSEQLKEDREKQSMELEQLRQAMDEGKFFMSDEELMSKRSKSVIGGGAIQKEGHQRLKFQELGRTVARTSSITTLRQRMSRERKSTEEQDGDKSRSKEKKWKIEEEIYQSGFERGVRMAASQQLSQLKSEQATFSEQVEKMLDRQHLTEGEEADLDRLGTDWLADKRVRLFLAPVTLLVTLAFLLWAAAYPIARQIVGH